MHLNRSIVCFFLCLLLHSIGDAQSVLYSSTIGNDSYTNFQIIGKAGNFYWLYKSKKRGHTWPLKEDRSFEVYDDRLHRVKEINSSLSDSVVKQYLIPQKYSFDQLMFKQGLNKTSVVINRFSQDGGEIKNAHLLDFPGEMALEDLLVSRSPDWTKICYSPLCKLQVSHATCMRECIPGIGYCCTKLSIKKGSCCSLLFNTSLQNTYWSLLMQVLLK